MADNQPEVEGSTAGQPRTVLLLCTDLMFSVQLQTMARHLGLKSVSVRPGTELPDGDLLVVDLAARADWEPTIIAARERGLRVVAFGPHVDTEGRRKAKAAGAERVLTNSNLSRDMPNVLKEIA